MRAGRRGLPGLGRVKPHLPRACHADSPESNSPRGFDISAPLPIHPSRTWEPRGNDIAGALHKHLAPSAVI